jgi:hypothetical protein
MDHGDMDRGPGPTLLLQGDLNQDFSLFGVLESEMGEIYQDLPESSRVASN